MPSKKDAANLAANRLAAALDDSPQGKGSPPPDERSEGEIIKEAQRTHKDTTATAERALRTVEQSKQLKNTMLVELSDQNKKLEKVDTSMYKINENLTYSEKILMYMRRCCLCWICDSCTGADPEESREKDWQRKSNRGTNVGDVYMAPPQSWAAGTSRQKQDQSSTPPKNSGPAHLNPDTKLPPGHERAGMRLDQETSKQNELIDNIHTGLDDLLEGAKMINDEISKQDKLVEHLGSKAEKTQDRIEQMNSKSQLRKYGKDGKPYEPKKNIATKLDDKVEQLKVMYR